MSFDPTQYSKGLIAGIEQLLKAAYDQGVQDGIERIVAAARAPIGENDGGTSAQQSTSLQVGDDVKAEVVRRAPRGLVPKVVARMLEDHPGKVIVEYEQMIDNYDSRVSEKSIGNELRRHEGKKYRRNEEGEWFPMSGNKEAAGSATNETPAASDTQTYGERYGTALDL